LSRLVIRSNRHHVLTIKALETKRKETLSSTYRC
jgi:hypothetical protein